MRQSGILMPVSSLPGRFGIGTFGKEAYAFVDFLKKSGQSLWQVLPLGPTSYGDSPYQSFSTFAGNPYFIDFDLLERQGFLQSEDYEKIVWGEDPLRVDYKRLFDHRKKVFSKLFDRFQKQPPADFDLFCRENESWLADYALFMALKDHFKGATFLKWEPGIRRREPAALQKWREQLKTQTQLYQMLQYFFFKQWRALKNYANDNGVRIIGDIPIYVAADSADVWSDPQQFLLDENLKPTVVAGCPPDAFSKTGQLWGNPVYNWDYMKKQKYRWWETRLRFALQVYDIVRIDHFRGFESFYCIKNGARTAKNGRWEKGPGMDLFSHLKRKIPHLPLIAEDLGFLTPAVKQLLKDSSFPGMKVLQFAFDSREDSDYLPHNYTRNCVVYTGTHDNDTTCGWFATADPKDVAFCKNYLRLNKREGYHWGMIKAAFASVADTAIIPMQDILGLSSSARMNIPSTVGGNWEWRCDKAAFSPALAKKLFGITDLYKRLVTAEERNG